MTSQNNEPLDTGEPRFYAMANTESEPLRSPCSLHDEVPLASLDSSATLDRQRRAFARHPGETAEDRIIRLRDEFEGWNGEGTGSEEDDEDREDREEDESERRRNERIGRDDGGKSWGEWWEKEM